MAVLATTAGLCPAGVLDMQVGRVDTAALSNLLSAEESPTPAALFGRHVIQLDGALDAERADRLAAIGLSLDDYLPQHAYVVNLDGVDPLRLLEVGFVQWVGTYEAAWKVAPGIGQPALGWQTPERQALAGDGRAKVTVTLFPDATADGVIERLAGVGGQVAGIYLVGGSPQLDVILPLAEVAGLADLDAVRFIEDAPELTLRNDTVRWVVQSNVPDFTPLYDNGLTGYGETVGIIDGRVRIDHCSFDDVVPIGPDHRKIIAYNTTTGNDPHGTHVAGIAVGDAGGDDDLRGVAYEARMVFNVLPGFSESAVVNRFTTHHNQGARIHTNSWGNDQTTAYDGLARGLDVFSHDYEDDLVLFAVTNLSSLRNPENAKNALAVGASGDHPSQHAFCSGGAGPTTDGRRKPEIFAPGCDVQSADAFTTCGNVGASGTSMAAPAVAGVAALVRQYYVDGFYPLGMPNPGDARVPSGALLKATLLNGATDLTGVTGFPSNQEGWGRVRIDDALHFDGDSRALLVFDDRRNASGLATGDVASFEFEVLSADEPLKATMAFTDAPGAAGTSNPVVNDLDLRLIDPSGTVYRGNVFASGSSVPGGTPDPKNNVEQVLLPSPVLGAWRVEIDATAVNLGPQGFAVIATGDVTTDFARVVIAAPEGVPDTLAPGESTDFEITIVAQDDTILAGSPTLRYRVLDEGPYTKVPLLELADDRYLATLPGTTCATTDRVAFYVTASGVNSGPVTLPASGPGNPWLALLTSDASEVFADDMETNTGWTVGGDATDGMWERGVPVVFEGQERGAPLADADGSGQCFLTDNDSVVINSDVDGGVTTLTSPVFDLSRGGVIRYAYWLNDIPTGPLGAEDAMTFEVCTDFAGEDCTVVRSYSVPSANWRTDEIRVGWEIPASPTVRLRVSAQDLDPQGVVEAGLDDVRVEAFSCIDGGGCQSLSACPYADVDCDNTVTGLDIAIITSSGNFGRAVGASLDPRADVDGDGLVTGLDVVIATSSACYGL